MKFRSLQVDVVRPEGSESVQVGFAVLEEETDAFLFRAGQFITLRLEVDGERVRRAYSICSAEQESGIRILVKRVEGGLVSNYMNEQVSVGDVVDVLPPAGKFRLPDSVLETAQEQERHFYFFGAGSGITPLMSMIKTVLAEEERAVCHLLYGNRNEEGVLFRQDLSRLELVYGERLRVVHRLSQPRPTQSKRWFGRRGHASNAGQIEGGQGRIDQAAVADFLKEGAGGATGFYICGPGGMIESTVEALSALGIDGERVHREYFSAPLGEDDDGLDTEEAEGRESLQAQAEVVLEGKTIELELNGRTTLVQALIDQGIEPPYSCLSGTCSTCMAKLVEGEVAMAVSIGLEEEDREKGYILTCQARPLSERLRVDFDLPELQGDGE